MGSLATRLGKLEKSEPVISPAVKQWLGWELTDADKAALDRHGSLSDGQSEKKGK